MPARMFRAPASVVRMAGKMSFVQDNGLMHGGPPGSDGNYWFSEAGAGVKPLVLVGTHNEITAFLMKRKESGIKNTIASLPDIYMGVAPYKPAPRFVGLFHTNLPDRIGPVRSARTGDRRLRECR